MTDNARLRSKDEMTDAEQEAMKMAYWSDERSPGDTDFFTGFRAALKWMKQQPTLESRLIALLKKNHDVSLSGVGEDETWAASVVIFSDDFEGGWEDVNSACNEPSPSAAIARLEARLAEWEAKHAG